MLSQIAQSQRDWTMFGIKRLFSNRSRDVPRSSAASLQAPPPAVRPAYQGLVEQLSTRHVAGWMVDPARPGEAPDFEVVLTGGPAPMIIAEGRAARQTDWLAHPPSSGPAHGFHMVLPANLSESERQRLRVRPAGGGPALAHAKHPQQDYKPIRYAALDIVDNCNLRCPFCLYDYATTHRTNTMSDEVFDAAIRLMPYVGEGHFWLSCLHEPTMHPQFASMIERIPAEFRSNIFYTSNLSRRMPQEYYDVLGRSGLNHLNVSIESRNPELYERMRKGAKHRIFMESWEKLLAACQSGPNPPKIRYIMMAYKSNLREIPELVAYLRDERMASFIDVRYTFNMSHIDGAFKQEEFLDPEEWHWLAAQLGHYPPSEVNLSLPPGLPPHGGAPQPELPEPAAALPTAALPTAALPAAEPPPPVPEAAPPAPEPAPFAAAPEPAPAVPSGHRPVIQPGVFEFRVSYNGKACIAPIYAAHRPDAVPDLTEINILDLHDPVDFLRSLDPG